MTSPTTRDVGGPQKEPAARPIAARLGSFAIALDACPEHLQDQAKANLKKSAQKIVRKA